MQRKLVICHLYADLMNLYGDRGNIIALSQRCRWRGFEVEVRTVRVGERIGDDCDILFMGGGQDKEQVIVSRDLVTVKADDIKQLVEDGAPALAVCGGFQLFGKYFKTGSGDVLEGIDLFDAWTVAGSKRCIGDVIVESTLSGEKRTLVGFENHSGKTYLGSGVKPLGRVVIGFGNNAEVGFEGAVYKNAIGTYLHGSLLPKNPWLTDYLIMSALKRRYGESAALDSLDDSFEYRAHQAMIERIRRRGRLDTGAI